jgi:hypothetical protein
MAETGHWIMGAIMGVIAFVGLILAAHALDAGIYIFGLGLFVFGVLFDFWLIKRSFDSAEAG